MGTKNKEGISPYVFRKVILGGAPSSGRPIKS
jgi:hypothetical protein